MNTIFKVNERTYLDFKYLVSIQIEHYAGLIKIVFTAINGEKYFAQFDNDEECEIVFDAFVQEWKKIKE